MQHQKDPDEVPVRVTLPTVRYVARFYVWGLFILGLIGGFFLAKTHLDFISLNVALFTVAFALNEMLTRRL